MVPTNALQRTFHLRYREATATCFTIDVQDRQYIVTAKHCLFGEGENESARSAMSALRRAVLRPCWP